MSRFEGAFLRQDIQIASQPMASSVIKEIHIKIMVRHEYAPVKTASKTTASGAGEDAEQLEFSYVAARNAKWRHCSRK